MMNECDCRVAALMEAIEIVQQTSKEFGPMISWGIDVAARRIRARMAQALEEAEEATA